MTQNNTTASTLNTSRGSEWKKWDLHIHTPFSICQEYGNTSDNWEKFILALENLPEEVKVIGITDYYFIDGYEKVMSYKLKNRLKNLEKIFPILEFRIDTFGSGNENKLQKINLHILFDLDEANLVDEIKLVQNEFISKIDISSLDDHKTKTLSKENFIAIGGSLKDGFDALIPSTKQVFDIINSKSWKNRTILFLGYKEWSNLDKNQQLKPLKDSLYSKVGAFLGNNFQTNQANQNWLNEFGNKRLLHSLDIHEFKYLDTHEFDKLDNKKPIVNYHCNTWIKADSTFEGLRQIIHEPTERVRIQTLKPDVKNERYLIAELQFIDDESLFGNQKILLNENLNAIIGGKSSGKSLLMYAIANSIDPEQVKRTSERLNFEGYKFKTGFDFKVTWKNGDIDLYSDSNKDNKIRKITYIPQLYINHLVEKNNKQELNSLIKNILLQDKVFAEFYEEKKNSIFEITSRIESLLNQYLNIRLNILENLEKQKNIGKSDSIRKSIENIEKNIAKGQIASNLTPKEFEEYSNLQNEKSTIEKNIKSLILKDDILGKVVKEVTISKVNLLGQERDENTFFVKGQIDRILEELNENYIEIDQIRLQLKSDLDSLIRNLQEGISKLEINSSKVLLEKNLVSINEQLKPFLEKIEGQKELLKLNTQLNSEKEKLQLSLVLEKLITNLKGEYNEIRNQQATLLKKRFDTYKEIEDEINKSKNDIGSDIILSCSLRYKKADFPLFTQTNRNQLSNENKFNTLFEEEYVKYDSIIELYKYQLSVNNEKLRISLDEEIPLKTKINLEDILRGLVKDCFDFDYSVTYNGDDLLSMSPGKKGTVLLILFLQISSAEHPILIDQPEDNLDNRTIYELLCKMIKENKKDRQIIIVSHNANLVVATDSENIIVANQEGQGVNLKAGRYRFEYVNGALENSILKNSKVDNILKCQGIKEHVCDILEGGNEAFKQRERKYSIK